MRKSFQIALSAIALILLLAFVVDAEVTWHTLQTIDLRWAFLAGIFMTADRLLMTYKWLLLLGIRGYRIPLGEMTALYCSAMVWGLALPSTVGADAIRTVLASRRGIRATDTVSSIVVERGIGFLTALALAIVSLGVLRYTWPGADRYDHVLLISTAVLAGGALLLVFSFSNKAFGLLERLVPSRWHRSAVMRKLERLHEAYRSLGTHSIIGVFTLLTLLEQLITIPFTWAVAEGLGLDVPFLTIVSAMPLAMLLSRLPVSFDGIGIFEGIVIAVMAQAGVRPGQSLAIAIASRLIVILALLPWWLAYSVRAGSLRLRSP